MIKPAAALEVHHRIPRCLLTLHERANGASPWDAAGVELWLEYEHEAARYGVDVAMSREDLAAMVEASTVLLPVEEHRRGHESDFVRWGRRGGMRTLEKYGHAWFALLGRRRHGRATKAQLRHALRVLARGWP
jgi:hypothetical protein